MYPFSPFLLPCSCSGSYVLLRFCTSFLTWPPGLLSSSTQIYSSCRDFSKLYIPCCQSSGQTLQIYIYQCQQWRPSLLTQLTYKTNLFCSSLTTPCVLLYVLVALSCVELLLVVAFAHHPYHILSLEWSLQTFIPLTSLRRGRAMAESASLCIIPTLH